MDVQLYQSLAKSDTAPRPRPVFRNRCLDRDGLPGLRVAKGQTPRCALAAMAWSRSSSNCGPKARVEPYCLSPSTGCPRARRPGREFGACGRFPSSISSQEPQCSSKVFTAAIVQGGRSAPRDARRRQLPRTRLAGDLIQEILPAAGFRGRRGGDTGPIDLVDTAVFQLRAQLAQGAKVLGKRYYTGCPPVEADAARPDKPRRRYSCPDK